MSSVFYKPIDIGINLLYDRRMDENGLAIKDIEYILGWSYPTALAYAKENGTKDEDGRWMVPASLVYFQVALLENAARFTKERFDELATPAASLNEG